MAILRTTVYKLPYPDAAQQYLLTKDLKELADAIDSSIHGVALDSGATPALNDLSDVDVSTSPAVDGQALIFDTADSLWKPGTLSATGGATTLNGLDDVDTFTVPPTDNQGLIFDTFDGLWKPGNLSPVFAVNDLSDVDTVTVAPTNGQTLVWDATAGVWEPASFPAGVTSLNGLSDVDTATVAPTSGQALVWDGTQWEPGTVASGVNALNDLSDVDTVTVAPTTGQSLVWDGTQWEPGTVSSGAVKIDDLSDVDTATVVPQNNQVLTFDTSGQWLPKGIPDNFSTHPLNDVKDVDTVTTAPVSGQVLGFNGTLWVPVDASSGSSATLDDTGWRKISPASADPWAGNWYIRRVGKTVTIQLDQLSLKTTSTGTLDLYTLPDGFRMQQVTAINLYSLRVGTVATAAPIDRRDLIHYSSKLRFSEHPGGNAAYFGQGNWITDDAFPSTFPGTAV